jgi:hypothetical protein
LVNGMMRVGFFFGAALLAVAVTGATVACNGLLGICSATVGELDGGPNTEAGVNCTYYCQTITQNCTGPSAEYQGDLGLCESMCNNLSLDNGSILPSNDNTLGCRIYYAQQAGQSDPATNCRFAGPLGGARCGDRITACGNFCSLGVPYCAGIAKPTYASVNDCNTQCLTGDAGTGAGFVFTTDGGSTGTDLPDGTNTLNCRFYHLENAYPTKPRGLVHCPHTQPVSATCF